jgi:hypothetical protein
MRAECLRLSLWGYPDEIDKREGRSFSCGPSSVYHLPRRSGRSPALPYPPGRRRQVYQIAGRIRRKNSFGFLLDATIPIRLDFCLMQRYPFRLDFYLMQHDAIRRSLIKSAGMVLRMIFSRATAASSRLTRNGRALADQ